MKLESISGGGKVLWGGKLPSLEAATIPGMAAASTAGIFVLAFSEFSLCPFCVLDMNEVFLPELF
jgi:hypothetical protein